MKVAFGAGSGMIWELSDRGTIKGGQCTCVAGPGLVLPVFCAGLCDNRLGGSGTLAGLCVGLRLAPGTVVEC